VPRCGTTLQLALLTALETAPWWTCRFSFLFTCCVVFRAVAGACLFSHLYTDI
jgi:hypothetical protein